MTSITSFNKKVH